MFLCKIFSFLVAMKKGCLIYARKAAITVKKGKLRLDFDQAIKCKNGFICGIDFNISVKNMLIECPDYYKNVMDISSNVTKVNYDKFYKNKDK